ncbi:MAG: DUF378 domain-containing protein [Thermoleophilaceae bacterium]|nr:DUF378 domain-containing protein [Thermoleophilaceae bacterium]
MEMIHRLEPVALLLMILAGLNWAIVALFETNLVTTVLGTGTPADVVYVLFGVSALVFVPRLVEAMHVGHGPHPRGV